MAFSQTTQQRKWTGGMRMNTGTWNGSGVTEGALKTGLSQVYGFTATGVDTTAINLKTSLAVGIAAGTVTFEFASGDVGTWTAWGR